MAKDKTDKTKMTVVNETDREEMEPLVVGPSPKQSRNNNSNNNSTNLDGHEVVPLIERSMFGRLDVFPFVLLYVLLIVLDYADLERHLHDDENSTVNDDMTNDPALALKIFRLMAFPLAFLAHLTVVLWQQWNVSVRCFVGYRQVSASKAAASFRRWTHCLVMAPVVGGQQDIGIVPVQRRDTEPTVVVVNFHDTIFRATVDSRDQIMDTLWETATGSGLSPTKPQQTNTDASSSLFRRLRYPTDLPLRFYCKDWKGHIPLLSSKQAHGIYGNNRTQIELPPFFDLLGQQLLAPFFLFQLFCVALWSLDEYWYYAIFTLFALLLFESTVAYNRRKSLERLRGTLKNPYKVWVYRHNRWMAIRTDEILPGDIVSLVANNAHSGYMGDENIHVPADMVLLQGSAVVDEALLTGESVPQLKIPIDADPNNEIGDNNDNKNNTNDKDAASPTVQCLDMEDPAHKQSILFGGTMIVSHTPGTTENEKSSSSPSSDTSRSNRSFPSPPNNGMVCFTLRTGFETTQGSLLRSMAHSSMKSADGVHTRDTFVFVVLLLICAVGSALMVLEQGWHDETRNRFRLILHVVLIVTSVVPPELPMELSLAVTNSVTELIHRCNVYCTEPYRIPWAGQVDMCCFDKTGTLTSDEMQLRGVCLLSGSKTGLDDKMDKDANAGAKGESKTFRNKTDGNGSGGEKGLLVPGQDDIPWSTVRVMAACHSLALNRSSFGSVGIIGDPLEKVTLEGSGYSLRGSNFVVAEESKEGQPRGIMVHHRFPFSSKLKRMTVLLTEDNDKTVWAVTKGAPETIKRFLAADSIPADYDRIFAHHMGLGQRVLAMAYRKFSEGSDTAAVKELGRASVERELQFAGFLVLDCPLKPDSQAVIKELQKSGHGTVMVTGDAVLTAAEVARQVGIMPRKAFTYELRQKDGNQSGESVDDFCFLPIQSRNKNHRTDLPDSLSLSTIPKLREMVDQSEASFCVTGAVLAKLALAAARSSDTPSTSISKSTSVSTTSSTQPSALNESNALLHPEAQKVLSELVPVISVFARHAPRQKEAVVAAYNLGGYNTLMCGDGTNDVGALKRAHVGISILSAPELESKQREATANIKKASKAKKKDGKKSKKNKSKNSNRTATLEESLRQLQEAQKQVEGVELGDASIASPFTSRAISIKCCKDVLQQGRCTLVTMLEIYKILGVNCLVNALVLTRLHMHGVKQGDRQLTILGMAIAVLFFLVWFIAQRARIERLRLQAEETAPPVKVTEQVDALRTMALDPVRYIVLPRFLGLSLMMPVLTLFSNLVGIVGCYLVSNYFLDITRQTFFDSIKTFFQLQDLTGGLIKAFIFGMLISLIGCFKGLTTSGGARGVGRSTIVSFVLSAILILIGDFLLWLILF